MEAKLIMCQNLYKENDILAKWHGESQLHSSLGVCAINICQRTMFPLVCMMSMLRLTTHTNTNYIQFYYSNVPIE